MKVVRTTLSLAAAGAVAAAMFTAPAQAAEDAKPAHNGYAQKNCTALVQAVRSDRSLWNYDYNGHIESVYSGGEYKDKVTTFGFDAKSVTHLMANASESASEGTWWTLSKGGAIVKTTSRPDSNGKPTTKTVARGYRFLEHIDATYDHLYAVTDKGALVRWDIKETWDDDEVYNTFTVDWGSKKILANSGFQGTKDLKLDGWGGATPRVLTLTKMGSLVSHHVKGGKATNRKVIANKRLAGYTGMGDARCKSDGASSYTNSLVLTHKNGHAYIWRDRTPSTWGLNASGFAYEGQIARWWTGVAIAG